MKIFLDDSLCKENLVPLSLTRNVSSFRIGILTIKEKWELLSGASIEISAPENNDTIKIPANFLPNQENFNIIINSIQHNNPIANEELIKSIKFPWQIFQWNEFAIKDDFKLITQNRKSAELSKTNQIIGNTNDIFIEGGVQAEHCIFNTTNGPIYIGKHSTIMEGSMIRGPFAILENSVVKMGSKIYGATTIGPNCVVGGEIKNSVIFENSNKAHDGYLGDSVIGAWCNLGAGTSNSNVKNTGGEVKYQIQNNAIPISCGFKGGLIIGDYSRCAINTSFNTGTVIGVCCNIFGSNYPDKYVDHFSWGGERYIFEKALKDIDNWKKMKNQSLTDSEIHTLKQIFKK